MKKQRKPFKDTKFGKWLKQHDSEMFEFVAARIPADKPIGKAVKIALLMLAKLTAEEKSHGSILIEEEN